MPASAGRWTQVFADDLRKAETLSLPITLIILVIAFGSLVAAGIPLLLAISAVAATIGLVALPSQIFPVDEALTSVILLIGLAVGVDYSLFYLRREREERAAGKSEKEALSTAAGTSGKGDPDLRPDRDGRDGRPVDHRQRHLHLVCDRDDHGGRGGDVRLADGPAGPARLARRPGREGTDSLHPQPAPAGRRVTLLGRLVSRVMRRPVLSIVVAGGALLALAVPGLGLNTVVTGPSDFPQDLEIVQTYNRVQEAFPSESTQLAVVVEADDVRSGQITSAVDRLIDEADRSDVLLPGTTVTSSKDGSVAEILIPTPGDGSDAAGEAALDEVRNDLVPATVGAVGGVEVNVAGDAAESHDYNELLANRMPLVFIFVLGLAFLLLMFTFRSIVIPLKAIVLNLLSVGAAYGILVLIFQNGWLESLLGFQSNGGITPWLPLFLFVILFGLSMDYHVFILSRIREYHLSGMNTEEAVRKGIATTAGTVTSAAVVMVAVFGIFAALSIIDMKEMGIGLAFAVLIDATVVRGVLLPASMTLLGDRNWYLPAWIDRRMPGGPEAVAEEEGVADGTFPAGERLPATAAVASPETARTDAPEASRA